MVGSIVFVHGTGVRLDGYLSALETARTEVLAAKLDVPIVPCSWGEPLGTTYQGLSLPDAPTGKELERQALNLAQWTWLLDDPLAELDRLAIRSVDGEQVAPPPGRMPEWLKSLEAIRAYEPRTELEALLTRIGLRSLWPAVVAEIINSPITKSAFERSGEARELPDAIGALARACAAELHRQAIGAGRPAPSTDLRNRLCNILVQDWGGAVAGLSDFLTGMFQRAGTSILRRNRGSLNALAAAPIGDVLLYQSRGAKIRGFIQETIENAPGPVLLLAHSLGGVASVDLLASTKPPKVAGLVTVGSQSPLFHEFGALHSLTEGAPLPHTFPPWLNVFDRNDFLSFVGEGVFPGRVRDFEVDSGQPFPDSHGAYFGNPKLWLEIARFVAR